MKKTIKTILSMLVSASLISTSCLAAVSYQYGVDDATKTISVTVSGAEKNQSISIQLLKPEKEIKTTYTKAEILSDFILMAQAPADAEGKRTFSASLDGIEPGDISIRINGGRWENIFYATPQQKGALVAEIAAFSDGDKEAAKTGLAEILEIGKTPGTAMKMLALTDENALIYRVDDKASLYEALYNITKKKTWNVKGMSEEEITILVESEEGLLKVAEDIEEMLASLGLASRIAGLNESLVDAIDLKDTFSFDEKYCKAYEDKLTADQKNEFTDTHYKGKNYLTAEKIAEEFENAVLDSICTNLKAWGEVEYFIENFGEDSGILMSTFESKEMTSTKKTKLYSYLLSLSFDDTAEFVNAANEKMVSLINEVSGGSSGGGGGKGSGGGSSSGGGGMTLTAPITPSMVTPKEELKDEKAEDKFSDLAGFDWAKEAVETLSEKGIVSGVGEGKYEPAREVKREEILAMLLRGFNIEASDNQSDFTDAAKDGWYTGLLATAKEKGFVSGRPDGTFGVGDNVTREDVCVMAYNIAKAMGKEFDTSKTQSFSDDAEASEYALDAIYALKNAGVINGKGEGFFAPKATCTRAEAAKIIFALIGE